METCHFFRASLPLSHAVMGTGAGVGMGMGGSLRTTATTLMAIENSTAIQMIKLRNRNEEYWRERNKYKGLIL